MKKILTSASLLAIGATSLNAAYAPGLTPLQTAKPWSISASLRGFYDDNYTTVPSRIRRDSFGFEVSPSVAVNLPLDQTYIGASYVYSMRYYEDRNKNRADHTHRFDAKLDHAFSERNKIELSDSFVIAQEPELFATEGGIALPLRSEGDNIRNTAKALFHTRLTETVGLQLGYQNYLYDYEQNGVGSYSARLDRMEHVASADLRVQMLPQTIGIIGYQFRVVDYTSDDPLFMVPTLGGPVPVSPDVRDNYRHTAYIGADHNFNAQLNGSIRVGGEFTDYHRVPAALGGDDDDFSPYADGNLTYSYAEGSHVQVGVRHSRLQTDVIAPTVTSRYTLDQEATAAYASLTHQITAKLQATLLGQAQFAKFEGGGVDGDKEQYYIFGANLAYRINEFLLAETGYNYDKLNSDIGRGFTRNRVYVGIRATY